MCDDLGEFLAHHLSYWTAVHEHGTTDFDGVKHLLTLLSFDWEGYAIEISSDFIYRVDDSFDLIANLSRFVYHLSYVLSVYQTVPRGPYLPP